MNRRGLLAAVLVTAATLLARAPAAQAHAALLRTVPEASRVLNTSPGQVRLLYSEAVEPRFAIVSVTDAQGHSVTAGTPHHPRGARDELDIALRRPGQGWYLVFWRVISADGHPVRGAFTFAVGPNPGPPPQFAIPSVSETAATPGLLALRWLVFLSAMSAIGLFAFLALIARPLVERVEGTRLRPVSVAFAIALAVALVATPVYALVATAKFALRSAGDVSALVPLLRVSQFGRSIIDLEYALLLFAFAAAVALWLDAPRRGQRSLAALLALGGALLAAAAALVAPGVGGHADSASPRGLALAFDWTHLAAGSVWLGGLIGLLVLWRALPAERRSAGLAVCVPRFSSVALGAVAALIVSGTGSAIIELPTLSSLWQTSYGKALLVKIGILLVALVLAATNLTRTRPRIQAATDDRDATRLLRRLVSGEVTLVAGALFAASVLTSLAPPAKALGEVGKAAAKVGPGAVSQVVTRNGYRVELLVAPNRAAVPNRFAVRITKNGAPVTGATVTTTLTMLDMQMSDQEYRLTDAGGGVYQHSAPALVMVGHWGLNFEITPPGKPAFDVLLVDRAGG
jgi:copper transport protein